MNLCLFGPEYVLEKSNGCSSGHRIFAYFLIWVSSHDTRSTCALEKLFVGPTRIRTWTMRTFQYFWKLWVKVDGAIDSGYWVNTPIFMKRLVAHSRNFVCGEHIWLIGSANVQLLLPHPWVGNLIRTWCKAVISANTETMVIKKKTSSKSLTRMFLQSKVLINW